MSGFSRNFCNIMSFAGVLLCPDKNERLQKLLRNGRKGGEIMKHNAYIKLQMGEDKRLQELFDAFWKARKELADYLLDQDEVIATLHTRGEKNE